jgi:hypothetical protein
MQKPPIAGPIVAETSGVFPNASTDGSRSALSNDRPIGTLSLERKDPVWDGSRAGVVQGRKDLAGIAATIVCCRFPKQIGNSAIHDI